MSDSEQETAANLGQFRMFPVPLDGCLFKIDTIKTYMTSVLLPLLLTLITPRVMSSLLLPSNVSHINRHCVKSVRVRSFSGPCFLAFGLNI